MNEITINGAYWIGCFFGWLSGVITGIIIYKIVKEKEDEK